MSYLHINNAEFLECLEQAKTKMLAIEERNSKDFVASQNLILRMRLCIYDIVHQHINQKLKKE